MHASSTIKRSAWLLLLAFIVGTVLVPVVHHAFHPHGLGQAMAAETSAASLATPAPDAVAAGCVICHIPVSAHIESDLALHGQLPGDDVASIERRLESDPGGISLSARAPPAA